jgi:hypothetical protein
MTSNLPRSATLNVAGLLVFGAMILIQIIGGVDVYPTIPPGLVISVAVAALTVLGARWWWTALIAAAWPVFLTVGAIASGIRGSSLDLDDPFVLTTWLIQMSGLAVALVFGIVFAWQRLRTRVPAR